MNKLIFAEDIEMGMEKKAITEEDVHNWKRRRLRVAKSAESLINLPSREHRLSRHFDDFSRINSCSGMKLSVCLCVFISPDPKCHVSQCP